MEHAEHTVSVDEQQSRAAPRRESFIYQTLPQIAEDRIRGFGQLAPPGTD
jgi:hypothetical protein